MTVLLVDLEARADLPPFQAYRWLPPEVPSLRLTARDTASPADLSPFRAVVLSGSTLSIVDPHPIRDAAETLVRKAVAARIPVLGICYGHQAIARALLGESHVRRAAKGEMGWLPVAPTPAGSAVFAEVPIPFHGFVAHFDEVCDLPADWVVTATSAGCDVQGLLVPRLRLMGFQFHPEMDASVGNACFAADRETLAAKGFDVDAILQTTRDDESGRILFPRFLAWNW